MPAQLVRLQSAPDLVDQVYRALLDAISNGTLAPGERITQESLAERLAVSRQPVLQALMLLKKDGFVLDAPGRGVQVSPLDPQWILKVYQVRGALDALAARLAAQQRAQQPLAMIEPGRKAVRSREVQAMIEADLAFHRSIYESAGNPLIAQCAQLHWAHLRRVMGAVLQSTRVRDSVWDEHERIARAIAEGDGQGAVQLIDQHGRNAGEVLASRLANVLISNVQKSDLLTPSKGGQS